MEAQSVIPGRISSTFLCSSPYSTTSESISGRDPTKLNYPDRRLRFWGSSSSLYRRMKRPARVTRESSQKKDAVFDDLNDDGILLGYQTFRLAKEASEVTQLGPAIALEL